LFGQENFPLEDADGDIHFGRERPASPFLAKGEPEWRKTKETV